jgi:integrase
MPAAHLLIRRPALADDLARARHRPRPIAPTGAPPAPVRAAWFRPTAVPAVAPDATGHGWQPPAALRALEHRTTLDGWAPKTRVGHRNAKARFVRFCDAFLVPLNERFPVSEAVLCAFAAHRAGRVAGATVRNDLAGLHAYHTLHGLPWPSPPRLRYIVAGVERARPASSRQALRPPVSLPLLRGVHEGTNLNVGLQAAVRACAFVAFYGQYRMGELLPEAISDFDPRWHPTRAAFHGGRTPSITLPWTKTTLGAGAVITLAPQPHSRTCPVTAIRDFLKRHPMPRRAHLFAYRVDGVFRPLTKRVFLAEVNAIASDLGLGRVTGHCFRIGGTTQLLASGVPPDVVKAAGRWASDSFLRYWREHERVLPQHVNDLIISGGPGH